ncbi:response regulator transcription factor [Eubacterium sp. MSJ-13]|uniref:response regulator transcription factor n=1 Tax=Eubacterium sp. MSJ-13 TaxID=2841513 RepID=UPI001C1182B1|nr:response regulator transcription factor [Eubacterium sp. MSJ-13]MBU5477660.1 response regulator transcription factor [Eubacterium sp. MSJ-13]
MKILIVEDEEMLADALVALFGKDGYLVDVCYDGQMGLNMIVDNNYDIVILDIMLPKIDGISVLRHVRKEGINTPIILLTSKSQLDDKVYGLDSGADDYIVKPFDAEELLARVRARTRNGKQTDKDEFYYSDIILNRRRHELKSGERKVKLGNKEYELLEYLLVNAGNILTKDMLISKVWEPDDEPEYNHLEVYISFLRKKLRFVQTTVKIVTTKNVGYSLEETTDD